MICKLCGYSDCMLYLSDKKRNFHHCPNCRLVFVPQENWIRFDDERRRYELHTNTQEHEGYLQFLGKIAHVIDQKFNTNDLILDFGSGKSAVLSEILQKKHGFKCDSYDPLFNLPLKSNELKYDVIILCEVIEHLRQINNEIELIRKHLSENGAVIISTKFYPEKEYFRCWWYKEDPTHINFFRLETLSYIANKLNKTVVSSDFPDIHILQT